MQKCHLRINEGLLVSHVSFPSPERTDLAHLFGVSTLTCAVLLQLDGEEFCAETLDLFLDDCASVKTPHDGAHPPRGRNGTETSYTPPMTRTLEGGILLRR